MNIAIIIIHYVIIDRVIGVLGDLILIKHILTLELYFFCANIIIIPNSIHCMKRFPLSKLN